MRIISGQARGRKLKAAPGAETRPTSDRIKESMFNIVQFEIEGRRVLDLFGGTGQLGLEALSRGAAEAVILDMSSAAVGIIRENARHTGLEARARVVAGEALQYLSSTQDKFDLIFLDPPYGSALLAKALRAVARFDILREGGIIVVECARDDQFPDLDPPYRPVKTYQYGAKRILTFTRREERD